MLSNDKTFFLLALVEMDCTVLKAGLINRSADIGTTIWQYFTGITRLICMNALEALIYLLFTTEKHLHLV